MDSKVLLTNVEDMDKTKKAIFFVLFFLTGLINHLGTIMIMTGSQNLALRFGLNNLMGFYQMAVILCSSAARLINSRYFIKISYMKRITYLSFYMFTAYFLLFLVVFLHDKEVIGNYLAFGLTLIPSFLMGTGYAFGESTILGFLRMFPKGLVGGWSSGTGLAGLTGAFISVIAKTMTDGLWILYISIAPVAFIYLGCFYTINRLYDNIKMSSPLITAIGDGEPKSNADIERIDKEHQELSRNESQNDVSHNLPITFKNLMTAFGMAKRYIINLGLVYFIEFSALSGVAERITHKDNLIVVEAFDKLRFETFNVCYQIGVFISRSSLPLVRKITLVEVFTLCQLANALFLILEYYFFFIDVHLGLFPFIIVLGFFGGGAYAACFYFILQSEHIESNMKELCVNIGTICNDIGTFGSSCMILLIHNYIMPNPGKKLQLVI